MDLNLSRHLLITLPAAIAVSCTVLAFFAWWGGRRSRSEDRIRNLVGSNDQRGFLRGNVLYQRLVRDHLPIVERLLPDDVLSRSCISTQLIKAGHYSPDAISLFVSAKLLCMVLPPLGLLVVAIVGDWPMHQALILGAVVGLGGMLFPGVFLAWQHRRRQRLLRGSLPDFVDLVVACLESGMGLSQSLAQVNGELEFTHPKLCQEFGFVMRETHLGTSIDVAIRNMGERTDLDEIRSLATFVQHSLKYGTAMGSALRELSSMLRFQREQRAEELAQKAAVKILIPTMLFIFPAIFVVLAGPAAIQISETFNSPSATEERIP